MIKSSLPLTTATHYVLIDYENIQPIHVNALKNGAYNIKVFMGKSQNKLPVTFVTSIDAVAHEYIQIDIIGKNALDIVIACYLGKLVSQDKQASFSIVSKDTGYDALIKKLNAEKINIKRVENIQAIKQPLATPADTPQAQLERAIAQLKKAKHTPTSKKALINFIKTGENRHLSEATLEDLHNKLLARGCLSYSGVKPVLQLNLSAWAQLTLSLSTI